jgi:hypothetical protein
VTQPASARARAQALIELYRETGELDHHAVLVALPDNLGAAMEAELAQQQRDWIARDNLMPSDETLSDELWLYLRESVRLLHDAVAQCQRNTPEWTREQGIRTLESSRVLERYYRLSDEDKARLIALKSSFFLQRLHHGVPYMTMGLGPLYVLRSQAGSSADYQRATDELRIGWLQFWLNNTAPE